MTRTLKEQYVARRVTTLREKVRRADAQLLIENKAATLLIEAMSEDDLQKVSAIIDKLQKIKNPGKLPKLTAAIEQAEAEINKYTAGGPLTAAWTKLKGLVGVDNPIVKVTTFANALEKGFGQFPIILKNNGIDPKNLTKDDLDKTLGAYLGRVPAAPKKQQQKPTGAVSDKELGNMKFSSGSTDEAHDVSEADDDQGATGAAAKIQRIVAQFQKALAPAGVFGAFKKVPYIDSASLAAELMNAPIGILATTAKTMNTGTKSDEVAGDVKDNIGGGGGQAGTKNAAPAAQAEPAAGGQQAAPTKNPIAATGTKPAGETPPQPRGGAAATPGKTSRLSKDDLPGFIKNYQQKLGDIDKNAVAKVIQALHAGGELG